MPVNPIPDDYPRVMAYLSVNGAAEAIALYRDVFGAQERMRLAGPDGKVGHAELQIGDSVVMLADEYPEMGGVSPTTLGGTPVTLMVYVEDVPPAEMEMRAPRRLPDETLEGGQALSVRLNHTIVWCGDIEVSARFLADTLGLPAPSRFGPFLVVQAANDISLDFHEIDGEIASQHYAFLVTEEEFDQIFGRITAQGLEYWADPALRQSSTINRNDGGRGVYFKDPDGHLLEILTRPYGSGSP